nr:ribonuclease H-like domain-containing protein [Tanacetum cinerariifolium]
MGFQNKNSLNFFNNDENESKSSEPYDDGRDNKTEISKGIDLILFEGTKNTDFTRWDEAVNPDDNDSAKAVSNVEEHAILEENNKKSEDISNAFLYGDLVEDVYMSFPDGYFDKSDTRVCKLIKSLYGLKHVPTKWNEKLTSVLLENDFKQSKIDFSLFIKDKNKIRMVLAELNIEKSLHVSLHCDNSSEIEIAANPVFHERTKHFERELYFFREKVSAGIVKTVKLDISNAFLYGDLVEDVYMSFPDGYFDKSDTRVCKLIKSLYGLKHVPTKWNEKLTSVLLENDFKQSKIDFSLFIKDKNKIRMVLAELNIEKSLHVSLHCDNSSEIEIAANPVFHERTKHFERELYFFREKVSAGIVKTVKVKFTDNTTDIFTKDLSVCDHNKFCDSLGMYDVYRVG